MTAVENKPAGVDQRSSGSALDDRWVPPGTGLWERDPAHQERPFCRLWFDVLPGAFARGTAEGFERLGLPLAEMRVVDVGGWFYGTMLPVPDDDFVARIHAAEQALTARTWRTIADEWHTTERSRFLVRNRDLQAVDPAELDDDALVVHTHDALDLLADASARHFLQAIAHWVGVGLLVNEAAEMAGWEPSITIAALAGSSPGSTAPLAALLEILDSVATDRSAAALLAGDLDASSTLDAMRASSPAVRQAIDAFLDEFGWQIFTGFDLTHQAMIELPSLFLSTLRTAARVPAPNSDRLAALLAVAPAARRDRVAQLIDDATTLYGVRDDDSGLTIQRPLGLVRRALLEAGRRSAAAGRLHDPDHVFEAGRDDLGALITGRGDAPHADLLSALSTRRLGRVASPPLRLGDQDVPPDAELPPAMGTIVDALLAAMSLEVADPGEPSRDHRELRGCGASAGVYEGRARIVDSDGGFEDIEAGDVLIATMTTPAYNVVVPLLGAVVTDTGGMLCHAAIVAREFGIPAVVGTATATTDIPDGAHVRVDGDRGTITLL
jgi:pyruvate,water dikinase